MPDQIGENDLKAIVAREIASALSYDKTELSEKRRRAIEYMKGEMTEWPAEKGRSSVVSRDTKDVISWILPGIIRLFSASGRMAIAEPVEPSDERWAESATDGINYAFWKDNEGYKLLYDGTYNSLLHGNGVIKHWWDVTPKTKISFHSGLTDEELVALLTPEYEAEGEDGPEETIELLAQTSKTVQLPAPDPETGEVTLQPTQLHDAKIKRTCKYGQVKLSAIAPEDFLINSEATSIKNARLTGNKEQKTRSELIEMGFDRDKVEAISRDNDDDATELARQDFDRVDTAATKPLELVTLYELYLNLDVDGDGIAERCQIFYAGFGGSGTILDWQVWEDEEVFSDIPCDPVPHRWDAESVFDKTRDVQEIKTVLQRQALDNLYASNNPQRVAIGRVLNPDELSNPSFGGTVFMEAGGELSNLGVEFFANHALEGIAYFDQVIEKRTGVSKTTMALDPEALQDQTATAAQLAHDAAYSQTELIARNQAELGWKNVFKNVLKLMIRHQDKPRQIRLENKQWAQIDPRHWNAEMDITIDTGLGTGSRDRDLGMLMALKNDQVMLAAAFREAGMIDKAVGMIPMLITTLKKGAEAAGIRSPEEFYPDVTDEEVAQAVQQLAQAAAQGDPKVQAEKQIAQMEIERDKQIEGIKSQAQAFKEKVQAEADVITKTKQFEFDAALQRDKLMADSVEKQKDRDHDIVLKQMELSAQAIQAREQRENDMAFKREEMANNNARADKDGDRSREIEMAKISAAKGRAKEK